MLGRLVPAAFLASFGLAAVTAAADDVDFLHDVRPILATRCFRCHSEALEQEAGLKLDQFAALMKGSDEGAVIVAGKSAESKLIQRITASDDTKMPPEGDRLTASQIATIKSWIDRGAIGPPEGAETKSSHWAFQKPARPPVPAPANAAFVRNPIDAFIAAKHEELKLTPLGEAPRHVLLRRVYFDLVGLPPTPDQLQSFLNDNSTDAYEKVVEELLKSPHHGERWGRHWMDVWRYSDWDGYGQEVRESKPHIWRWRDWIIESLNADKPYDRMVQEMLAGDELAPDDPQTLRATGYLVRSWYKFNRNTWLDSAIEHTGKAFMATTFNCARCHSHMYDPIANEEYYRLRAVFEPYDVRTDRVPGEPNVEKDGLVRAFDANASAQTFVFVRGNEKDPVKDKPLEPGVPKLFEEVGFKVEPVTLPAAAYYEGVREFVQQESLAAARKGTEAAKGALDAAQKQLAAARQKQVEFAAAAANPSPEKKTEPLIADDFSKRRDDLWSPGPGKWDYSDSKLVQSDPRDEMCSLTSVQPHPKDFLAKLRWKTTGGDVYKSVGIAFDAVEQKQLFAVYLSHSGPGPHLWQKLGGADSYPPSSPKNSAVELGREYEMQIAVRGQSLNVWIDGQFVLAYKLPEPRPESGKLIVWTYDATAEFLQASLEALPGDLAVVEPGGKAAPMAAVTAESLAIAVSDAEKGAAIAEKTLAAAQLNVTTVEARIAADKANYATPAAANAKDLSLAAGKAERDLALLNADKELQAAEWKAEQTKRSVKPGDMASEKAAKDAETALEAAKKAREAAVAAVGQPSESYTRLTSVHPTTSTGRRLALAKFITSKENPLAARVAINHLWMRHFGSPLVPSVFDFGMNGKPPTNQALLDWLAVELMESGWSMKHVHRLMVTSTTYRLASGGFRVQGSGFSKESGNRGQETGNNLNPEPRTLNPSIDPENKYYWRANPRRLEAEIVRDATLAVAGSLDPAMGGPEIDQNAGLTNFRRSVYFRSTKEKKMTFLALFDSANVVECYRRSESIAPQQALAMANSPLTLAQSRVLAKKLSDSLGNVAAEEAPKKFVENAFLRVLSREPSAEEVTACLEFLTEQSKRLSDATALSAFTAGAAASVPPSGDPTQRARENLVHVLMNHNDFVTVR